MAFSDIPFRVRIGVTGHRTLQEPERIAVAIRGVLDTRIWDLFDPPVPLEHRATRLAFTILTPLAEGADRLVAKEILNTADAAIEAVLPLAKDDYLRDFAEAASKAEFKELYRKARQMTVLEPPAPSAAGAAAGPEDDRERAYEQVGHYIADHCDILIAVWDGKPSRGRGGTAEIVAYARERKRPLIIVSSDDPVEITAEKEIGLSGRAYDRIGMFNRFSVPEEEWKAYVGNVIDGLFAAPEGENLAASVKSRIRERLIPWYVRASLIAKRNQKRYFRSGLTVYALSPLAVAAVASGILVPAWALAAFSFEFVILLTIYAVIKLADRRRVHKKWIETRLLAERLRSAIFLSSCGVKPGAISVSPFMTSAPRADDWIARTFDEIMARAGEPESDDRRDCAACVAFVRARWIGAQIEFHTAKSKKAGRLSRLLEKMGRAAFLAAIGASAWHLLSITLGHHGLLPALEKPAVFLALVLPALGAAIGGVRAHREYSRLEKRSQSMAAALRELDERFAAATDVGDLEVLLRETERLMLQETQDWLMLMNFAKVEAV